MHEMHGWNPVSTGSSVVSRYWPYITTPNKCCAETHDKVHLDRDYVPKSDRSAPVRHLMTSPSEVVCLESGFDWFLHTAAAFNPMNK